MSLNNNVGLLNNLKTYTINVVTETGFELSKSHQLSGDVMEINSFKRQSANRQQLMLKPRSKPRLP